MNTEQQNKNLNTLMDYMKTVPQDQINMGTYGIYGENNLDHPKCIIGHAFTHPELGPKADELDFEKVYIGDGFAELLSPWTERVFGVDERTLKFGGAFSAGSTGLKSEVIERLSDFIDRKVEGKI